MADNKNGASQASQMNELPRLRRLSDDRTHTLTELNIIGRHADCDLLIDDEKGVSRKHARITLEDGVVHVEDLGSLNGTLINGDDCVGKQALRNGDILVFDEQEYELFVPYEECDDFDPAMTVIANRSAIKKRIEKKRAKKQQLADTSKPILPEADGPFSDRKAANHTIIDQPRKSVAPSMRIVDEEFLKGVHDDHGASEGIDGSPDAVSEDGDSALRQAQTLPPMRAAKEAFDVSDDEVEDLLHADVPGGAPTQFVPDQISSKVEGARLGSAPFLSRSESMQSGSTGAAAFTRGTQRTATSPRAGFDTDSGVVHAQLIVLDGNRHYRLPLSGDQTSWSVGSAAQADLLIAQPGVAADHAIILMEGSTWTLCDRGSAGGCTVNGLDVSVARIQPGDRMSIGSAECLFAPAEIEHPENPAPAQAAPAQAVKPEPDPFADDPMDTPRLRVEIPMDDRIWDEHEQQLYRDTSRDQILRARKASSRHDPDRQPALQPAKPGYASWEPPAKYGRLARRWHFMPSARTLIITLLGIVAMAVLGALAYLVI